MATGVVGAGARAGGTKARAGEASAAKARIERRMGLLVRVRE